MQMPPPIANHGGPYSADESVANNGMWPVNFNATGSSDDFGNLENTIGISETAIPEQGLRQHISTLPQAYSPLPLPSRTTDSRSIRSITTATVSGNGPPVCRGRACPSNRGGSAGGHLMHPHLPMTSAFMTYEMGFLTFLRQVRDKFCTGCKI